MDARGQDLGGGGGAAQPPSRSRDGDAEPAGGAAPPSHAQLVAMIEHAAVAIVAVDVAGRVVTFNRRAVETFGWPGDAIFGRSVDALFATRPPDGAWSHLRDVLGDPATAALASRALRRGRRRDGHEFAAAVTCRRLGDDDAALVMLEVRDRTDELRRADERAAETRWSDETRRWSQALLATARVGIVAHDAAGAISFNHRAEELLGIDLVRRPGEF
ncbi:MAG: PAS domain S-box protein, partial [Myxococcales bacterium]|nr:PAS domain S-box protein [Myxococcales bacterium]